jgi:hypothetical protein
MSRLTDREYAALPAAQLTSLSNLQSRRRLPAVVVLVDTGKRIENPGADVLERLTFMSSSTFCPGIHLYIESPAAYRRDLCEIGSISTAARDMSYETRAHLLLGRSTCRCLNVAIVPWIPGTRNCTIDSAITRRHRIFATSRGV